MDYDRMIETMTPDVYRSLKTAIELGKWPNGVKLTPDQRAVSMRAVIAYEHHNEIPEEQCVGYIDRGKKQQKHDEAIKLKMVSDD